MTIRSHFMNIYLDWNNMFFYVRSLAQKYVLILSKHCIASQSFSYRMEKEVEGNSVLKKSQGSQDMILTLFLQVIDVLDLSYKINDFRSVLTTRRLLLNTCWSCKTSKRKLSKISWKTVLVGIEKQYEQRNKSFWQKNFRCLVWTKVNRNFKIKLTNELLMKKW